MKALLVGANMIESQANAQVREAIKSSWQTSASDTEVISVPLSVAPSVISWFAPDVVLCCGSYLPESAYFGELIKASRAVKSKTAFWASEEPYEIDASYRLDCGFGAIFTCDKSSLYYFSNSRLPAHHLPLGATPSLHYRDVVPYAKRDIDIFFCGVAFNNRKSLLHGILPRFSDKTVLIIGPGWSSRDIFPSSCRYVNDRIDADDLVDLYTRSKVVLNIGRDLHFENRIHMLCPSTPGPRTFEAALAGCCQVYYEESCEMSSFFDDDEIITVSSPQDMEDGISWCLDNQAACEAIAKKAQEKTLEKHTYAHRISIIAAVLGIGGKQ